MTRAYLVAVVLDPTLSDAELERKVHALKETVKKFGGELTKEDVWGRKPTAYPLHKSGEAFYVFFTVDLDTQKIFGLDQELKLTEHVLRHLITLNEGEMEAETEEQTATE